MKKVILLLVVAFTTMSAMAFQRAFYVKKGDEIMKFNFGVASDLKFSNNGRTLNVTGYGETINLDEIDYITFNAPVSDMGLTPASQKEKMIEIGEAVNAVIDLDNVDELLKMLHVYTSYSTDVNGDGHCPPVEFRFPREFWDINNAGDNDAVASLAKTFTGDFSAINTLASRAVDLYRAKDYNGIWVADEENEEWKKSEDADYLEIRFLAQDRKSMYSARLEYSENITVWTTDDFVCEAPVVMTLTLRNESTVLAKATIKTTLVQDKSIAMDIEASAGKYAVQVELLIVDDAITENVNVTVDGKYFMEGTTKIDGKGLLTYSEMKPAIKDCFEYYDETTDDWIDADPTDLFAHLFRAHSKADVLKQLQIEGRVYGFDKLYDALSDDSWDNNYTDKEGNTCWTNGSLIDWNPESKILTYAYNKENVVENIVSHLGNYSDLQFFYDGKSTMQGFLGWETGESVDEYEFYSGSESEPTSGYVVIDGLLVSVYRPTNWIWDEVNQREKLYYEDWRYEMYNEELCDYKVVIVDADKVIVPQLIRTIEYVTTPLVIFPDLTTYALEDYFTESSFQKLIDDYDDIINVFKKICNIKDDEPDYYDPEG